jgi:hypothetical protein
MGDNNYPTYEQRELGPLEAARRDLQRDVDAGRITQEDMNKQHEENKLRWKDWGSVGLTRWDGFDDWGPI